MSSDRQAWPAVTYEALPWVRRLEPGMASRTQIRRHAGPYRAAVLPEIARMPVSLPPEVAADAEQASLEISRFDAEMGGEIAPFGAVLLRSELAASSQIENLTASARAIAEAELRGSGRRNADQIVANVRAMDAAVALSERLDGEAILAMHQALMSHTHPTIAGRWREEQVWIGGTSLGPHAATFVPPHHDRVQPGIADLVAFMGRDDLPVLVQAAVSHAQFETIHPFPDGNGRTGRALLHALLRNKSLTRNVTVPVSAGLLVDTEGYVAALEAYRRGDLAPIVDRMASAAFAAVVNGRALVADLRETRAAWHRQIRARSDSAVWRLTDLLIRHPVVDSAFIAERLQVAPRNVYRFVEVLVTAGVLSEFTDRARNRAWRAPEVLDALDAFATRAGRRTAVSGA
jgi:Fic family protein